MTQDFQPPHGSEPGSTDTPTLAPNQQRVVQMLWLAAAGSVAAAAVLWLLPPGSVLQPAIQGYVVLALGLTGVGDAAAAVFLARIWRRQATTSPAR